MKQALQVEMKTDNDVTLLSFQELLQPFDDVINLCILI